MDCIGTSKFTRVNYMSIYNSDGIDMNIVIAWFMYSDIIVRFLNLPTSIINLNEWCMFYSVIIFSKIIMLNLAKK